MAQSTRPVIGITLGDPAGIGPEVIAKSLARPSIRKLGHFMIIGERKLCPRQLQSNTSHISFIECSMPIQHAVTHGRPSKHTAHASLSYIDTALGLLKRNAISALVTGPIHKEGIRDLGRPFQGHTEYIANYFKVKKFGMMFVARDLKSLVVTRHIPLARVSNALTQTRVKDALALTAAALNTHFKIHRPTIAICGLNPHAGEGGKIGSEEKRIIIPAIRQATKKNIRIVGPLPSDTLFYPKIAQQFDAIVAMYHDQGLIPLKTLYFNELVNMTVGLPFVRTSPAHGTAFNIAGKNKADPSSMCAAIKLAARLSH